MSCSRPRGDGTVLRDHAGPQMVAAAADVEAANRSPTQPAIPTAIGHWKRRWSPEGNRVPLAGAADAGPSTSPWLGREAASVWGRQGASSRPMTSPTRRGAI